MAESEDSPFLSSLAHHAADPFRLLVEAVVDYAIFMVDPAGHVASWNPGAERIYGYQAEEILGQPVARFAVGEDTVPGAVERELSRVLREGRLELECRRARADGSMFWATVTTTTLMDHLGNHIGFAQVTRDITERKLLIHSLGERVKELTCLHGAAQVLQDDRLSTADWLRELARLLPPAWQYPNETEARITVGDLEFATPGFTRTPWLQRAEFTCAQGAKGVIEVAYRTEKPKEAEGPFLTEERNLINSIADVLRSALDRRQAEAALTENTARLHEKRRLVDTLLDSLPGVVLLFGADGRFHLWNRALEQVTGHTAEEFARLTLLDLFAEERAVVADAIRAVLATGQHAVECHLRSRDGQAVPYYFKCVRLDTEEGPCVLSIGIDLSEIRRLEDQLRQAQKIEAIGHLAGGVAHDFNNLLVVINGYSDILLHRLGDNDPLRNWVAEIYKAGEQAAALTQQLLAFSRRQILQPKVLDLNAVLSDTEKLLRRLIGEDIVLKVAPDPALGPAKVDPGQVQQVLINLAVNARDAMPQGGRLTIETRNVTLDEAYARTHPGVPPGCYSMLSVSDSGAGMDEATMPHVFEPFFTTKEPGKGTGLGLAVVHGVVRQNRGHIEVHSKLGYGTTFNIYFPHVHERAWPRDAPAGLSPMPQGAETVLLVEDDDAVRTLARHVLSDCGYAVLEAKNGEEALRVAAAYAGPINLLVSDVVMPHLGGRELAERLAPLKPGVKVLFTSGYSDDAVLRHGVREAAFAFLQKPFTPTSLAHKVREVLDAND